MMGILIRKRKTGPRDALGRRPRGTEARDWNGSAGRKGKPRIDNYHHEPGRSKEGFYPEEA